MSLPSFQSQDSRPNTKDSLGKERTRRRGKQVQALRWGILLGLGFAWELGPWEVPNLWYCGAVGVRGGGSCTQSIPRASFSSVWILTPRAALGLSCGSSSEQQHLLSYTGDILGYLGLDPQLLRGKPLSAQQADEKWSFLGCGQGQQEAEQGQSLALVLSPTAQVELDPPRRGKCCKLAVPTSWFLELQNKQF